MKRKDPFKRHRFPREIFLRSAELHLMLHPSTDGFASLDLKSLKDRSSTRLVVASPDMFPFGTLLGNALRAADETYVRVGGKWRYLWRAVDQNGQMIDFRLTARRDAQAARIFLRQARDNARLYQPMTIISDKAHSYAKAILEINQWACPT